MTESIQTAQTADSQAAGGRQPIRLFQAFQDGMVLQHGQVNPIWGRCQPGLTVRVDYPGGSLETQGDAGGAFRFELPPLETGGPYDLCLSYIGETSGGLMPEAGRVLLRNILAGDVFILAGQSNMELPLSRTMDKLAARYADFADEQIREFRLPIVPVFGGEAEDWPGGGSWKAASPENWPAMGALGVSFARKYREAVGVPVGLINMAAGGTPIESWLPPQLLADEPEWVELEKRCQDSAWIRDTQDRELAELEDWYARLNQADPLLPAVTEGSRERPGEWKPITVPGMFTGTEFANRQGSFWLRRTFDLDQKALEAAEGRELKLYFGQIVDADVAYLNGREIGRTEYQYPPRRYPVPAGLLQEGENEILIRLIVNRNTGGSTPGRFYGLKEAGSKQRRDGAAFRLDLSGEWAILAAAEMEPLPQMTFFQYMPCGLYQSFLAPARGLAVRGALWYQGESNGGRPHTYRKLFSRLIGEFRELFGTVGEPALPFVFVQLTSWAEPGGQMDPASWPLIREAQRSCLDIPGTAMVVSTDVGERHDLHPQDKWTLGVRADLAMRSLLGLHGGEFSGPVPGELRREGSTILIIFRHAEGGLRAQGDLRDGFRLQAGGRWSAPEAVTIRGSEMLLTVNPAVIPEGTRVTGVRFAWENCPLDYAIYNADELPASPFSLELQLV